MREEPQDADLIGRHGRTVYALWPAPHRSTVRRLAVEAASTGRFKVVADGVVVGTCAAVEDAMRQARAYGETVLAVEPGPGYPVGRLAIERTTGEFLLIADGRILKRFGAEGGAAAIAAFQDLNPGRPATVADLCAETVR